MISVGQIALLPFPFTDLNLSKLRPVLLGILLIGGEITPLEIRRRCVVQLNLNCVER